MNPFGSYKCLRDNAVAAVIAAIEIYNKPRMEYRSECFIILMANAWELIFKAILSKNRIRLYYPKKRGEKYRSLTLHDAMKECENYFPENVQFKPVFENVDALSILRNNAIHFYNESNFRILIYGLAQTSIVNFRDLTLDLFKLDISDEINLALLPLAFSSPPDPIRFLKNEKTAKNSEVAEFIKLIAERTRDLEAAGLDTGRFLTVFTISLQSTKKIVSADIAAAIGAGKDATIIQRNVDPNKSHPLLRNPAVAEIGNTVSGLKFTSHTFEAIAWTDKLKANARFCWKPDGGGTIRYSREVVTLMKGKSKQQIEQALNEYANHLKSVRKK